MGARAGLAAPAEHRESSAPPPGVGSGHSPPPLITPQMATSPRAAMALRHRSLGAVPVGPARCQGCCPCSSLWPCPSPATSSGPFISGGGTNGAVRCHQPRDMTGCGAGAPRTEQPCLSEPPDTPHNGQMDETLKVGPGAFSTLFWVKTLLERS